MKTTFMNAELIAIMKKLNDFSTSDTKFPGGFLWKMKLNKKAIADILAVYEECEKELLEKYADDSRSYERSVLDENGNQTEQKERIIRPEYLAAWQKDMGEVQFQKTEVEIKNVSPESIADLALSPSEWSAIEFMIEEE